MCKDPVLGHIISSTTHSSTIDPSNADPSEQEAKCVSIITTKSISNKVKPLIDDCFVLGQGLGTE